MSDLKNIYKEVSFQGHDHVLNIIRNTPQEVTALSKLKNILNYEIKIPCSAVLAYCAILFIVVGIKASYFKPVSSDYTIRVIHFGDEYEKIY